MFKSFRPVLRLIKVIHGKTVLRLFIEMENHNSLNFFYCNGVRVSKSDNIFVVTSNTSTIWISCQKRRAEVLIILYWRVYHAKMLTLIKHFFHKSSFFQEKPVFDVKNYSLYKM